LFTGRVTIDRRGVGTPPVVIRNHSSYERGQSGVRALSHALQQRALI
jgi:hypothetical protein